MARFDLSSEGVAAMLGVSPKTVRAWASRGQRTISWPDLLRLDEMIYERRRAAWQPFQSVPAVCGELHISSTGTRFFRFWCDYCQALHMHGYPDRGTRHRAAHCTGGRIVGASWTPYMDHGYCLETEQ